MDDTLGLHKRMWNQSISLVIPRALQFDILIFYNPACIGNND